MPLPSTRVVHPHWAEHHAPVTEGAMNATVRITHGATGGGWDPVTGPSSGEPVVTYGPGPARVTYPPTQPGQADAADQEITTRTVLVSLPRGSAAQTRGARVKVLAVDANGPQALVGRVLVVDAAGPSSLSVEQQLRCVDDQANQPEG